MDRNDRTAERRTNIVLDETLVAEAMRLSGASTKRQVVDLALRELVRKKKRTNILDLVGKIKFHEGFDPKDGFS